MRSQRGALKLVLCVLVVVVVGGGALWWFFVRSDAKPPARIVETKVVGGGTLEGTWTVKPSDGLGSYVGYRAQEQYVGAIVQSDATGRTTDVTGSLRIAGTIVSDVTVTADLRTLRSDKDRRDHYIQDHGLESNRFPEAKFVLTAPIAPASAPARGQTISTPATGNFTLHGVTKAVTIPLQGRWDGKTVQVVGHLPIVFADYAIQAPSIGGFVSVRDQGEMELQLFFTHT